MSANSLGRELREHLRRLTARGAEISLLATKPRPIVVIGWPGGWGESLLQWGMEVAALQVARSFTTEHVIPILSTAHIEALPTILRNACVASPTGGAQHFNNYADEVLAYHRSNEFVVQAFDMTRTRCLSGRVTCTAGARELPGNLQVAGRLKRMNVRSIPTDPWKALLALIVLGEDHGTLRKKAEHAIADCHTVEWV